MALVDPGSLGSSLLVGSLHRRSDGSLGSSSSSLVASKLSGELLLRLLLGSIKLEVGSFHGSSDLVLFSLASRDSLGISKHLLLVLGETSSRGLLGSSALFGHSDLDFVHLLLEGSRLGHQLLLFDHGLVHRLKRLGSVSSK